MTAPFWTHLWVQWFSGYTATTENSLPLKDILNYTTDSPKCTVSLWRVSDCLCCYQNIINLRTGCVRIWVHRGPKNKDWKECRENVRRYEDGVLWPLNFCVIPHCHAPLFISHAFLAAVVDDSIWLVCVLVPFTIV